MEEFSSSSSTSSSPDLSSFHHLTGKVFFYSNNQQKTQKKTFTMCEKNLGLKSILNKHKKVFLKFSKLQKLIHL